MRGYRIVVAPELIAEGRRLYEQTDTPVSLIAKHMGLTRSTLNYRITDWKWTRRRVCDVDPPVELPVPVDVAAAPREPPPMEPALPFPERLRRVIDAEMQVAERTLKMLGPASSAEAERTTRILAIISRTVQEIQATAEGRMPADEADDDPVPRDPDEFRLELARRIRNFVEARRSRDGGIPAEPRAALE
jgi:hypothetical protein